MSTPDSHHQADEVGSATRALDRELRRLRIPRTRRSALVEEVRADLRDAAGDGLTPEALLGDVATFAREAVSARGWTPRPRDWRSATTTAVTVGVVALAVGYLLLLEVLNPLMSEWIDLTQRYPVAGPLLTYAALALIGIAGALAGFARSLSGRPAARTSVTRATALLPVAAALGVGAAMLFGRAWDYSTSLPVVLIEVALVALPCAGSLWLARWWGLRSSAVPAAPPVSAG
ncbi:hypothetical protein [Blastococcus haudaquaticus]|uniref:Uncharacterized protein n=1 Tax=Blastococcus haudaquaticus TaxID=1938745 RepID=A0A286H3L0_9ACTN|nr:hypothetical protein [Blastococcus haudaquaticus]SOE02365.1 hypothetical protein SAMN06272739_3530 [Blastococcus haudaquaticus]